MIFNSDNGKMVGHPLFYKLKRAVNRYKLLKRYKYRYPHGGYENYGVATYEGEIVKCEKEIKDVEGRLLKTGFAVSKNYSLENLKRLYNN